MTRQKSLKRDVRARMAKTGERYTAARSQVVRRSAGKADPAPQDQSDTPMPDPSPEMPVAEDSLREKTGRGWEEWLTMLDQWGATNRSHTEIARWLVEEQGVHGWWAQSVTVGYERARGRRATHQTSAGFSVGVTRTIGVPAMRASEAFTDPAQRSRWLGKAELRERTVRPGRAARFDWVADGSRLIASFDEKSSSRTTVSVQHERLPDAASAEAMKAFWRERLTALKEHLEATPE